MNQENILGERIKEIRTEQKLSQDDLAKKIQVSRLTIGKYERGERVPDATTLNIFSHVFNVSCDYLLGNSSCKKIDNVEINRQLGLSDKAINNIKLLNSHIMYIQVFNCLIERLEFLEIYDYFEHFNAFFNVLYNYCNYDGFIDIEESEKLLKNNRLSPEMKRCIDHCKKYGYDNIILTNVIEECEINIIKLREEYREKYFPGLKEFKEMEAAEMEAAKKEADEKEAAKNLDRY